jgi:hypothetical protein
MRCIFCKTISDDSTSVEHIIPESLGNTEHVLPKGWVCDTCNNYFARKVEKPFLDSLYGRHARFEMSIPNKRGRTPFASGFHVESRTKIDLGRSSDTKELWVGAADGEETGQWILALKTMARGTLIIPAAVEPERDSITSRFIGKIALESLAKRFVDVPGANAELVDKPELDELRQYVRLGQPKSTWPIHVRRIYPADFIFPDDVHGPHQILHEWTILTTEPSEFYSVVAIFGIEYTINLGGPELDGYLLWLKHNQNRSPLANA